MKLHFDGNGIKKRWIHVHIEGKLAPCGQSEELVLMCLYANIKHFRLKFLYYLKCTSNKFRFVVKKDEFSLLGNYL